MSEPTIQPRLAGERVVLRPPVAADRGRLLEILSEPEVARWWGTAPPGDVVDELLDADTQASFVIEVDGRVVGSVQVSEEADPDYRRASVDIFLDTAHQGRGLGRDALRTIARYLFSERGHHRITIDPAASNARAIAAYRSVGFRPVGVMRRYERGRDGTFHDGLLMDLLARELR